MPGTQVVVLSAGVGAGHDAAAEALLSRLHAAGVCATRHDYLDALPAPLPWILRRGYPLAVGYTPWFFDWLFRGIDGTGWVHAVVLGLCRLAHRRVRAWTDGAAVIVSTYMLASQTLGQLKDSGRLPAPVVTFVPDPAVHRLWIHPRIDYHYSITAHGARAATERLGVPVQVVRPLVSAAFTHAIAPARRATLRAELGLPAGEPTVLVAAGSLGLGKVPDTVTAIQEAGMKWIVVLCGHNQRLRHGWRDDVADLMAASDVLVHNAGGVSLSESLLAGLPAVTYQPLPGHGRANATILAEAELTPWASDIETLATSLHQAIHSTRRHPAAAAPGQDLPDQVIAMARSRTH